MKTLTVKVPEELAAELATVARHRGQSRSTLVREALVAYVRQGGAAGQGASCYELASDLAGSFAGPVDLGRNSERYLAGFGR